MYDDDDYDDDKEGGGESQGEDQASVWLLFSRREPWCSIGGAYHGERSNDGVARVYILSCTVDNTCWHIWRNSHVSLDNYASWC